MQLQTALASSYTLQRELGRGGMATVYLARDLRHDRPVALKVLHPELAATLGPERFLREIKLAARLQHPHILTVLDSGESAGQLWFTMPFVEGESLRDRLNREKQLPVADALRIAREAATALDYAHRHDTIHRDIKPENLLLTSDGQVLVADFGVGRALNHAAASGIAESRLTEAGMVVGTAAYMSPEQASGQRDMDGRTDVYSLGVVLYEMLVGETPFTGPTAQAIIARRFSGEVPSVRKSRPSVSEEVERVIAQALAMVPADRFATASDLARALDVGNRASSSASGDTLATSARPPAVRSLLTRPLTAVLAIGFLLGLGVLFAWRRNHPGAESAFRERRVAVLPFENLGDSADAYFADGITDAVRGKLTAIRGMRVTASNSSSQYRGTSKSPKEIGRELGVDYLLTGKVRWQKGKDGASRVQVSPELIEVATADAKWQQPFDAALTDVFQVQADVAGRVAQALKVEIGTSQQHCARRPAHGEPGGVRCLPQRRGGARAGRQLGNSPAGDGLLRAGRCPRPEFHGGLGRPFGKQLATPRASQHPGPSTGGRRGSCALSRGPRHRARSRASGWIPSAGRILSLGRVQACAGHRSVCQGAHARP